MNGMNRILKRRMLANCIYFSLRNIKTAQGKRIVYVYTFFSFANCEYMADDILMSQKVFEAGAYFCALP